MLSCAPWATTDYGRIQLVTTTNLPTEAQSGTMVYASNTNQLLQFTGKRVNGTVGTVTFGQWMIVSEPSQTISAPTYTNVTTTSGTSYARSRRSSGMCDFLCRFTLGASSAVTGPITVQLPYPMSWDDRPPYSHVIMYDSSATTYYYGTLHFATVADVTTATIWAYNAAAAGALTEVVTSASVPMATVASPALVWATSDMFQISLRYNMLYPVTY